MTNDGVDLNLALINYGLDFLRKKSYKKVQAPFMMNKDMMSQTAQLSEFDEALYKVISRKWAQYIADNKDLWRRCRGQVPDRYFRTAYLCHVCR